MLELMRNLHHGFLTWTTQGVERPNTQNIWVVITILNNSWHVPWKIMVIKIMKFEIGWKNRSKTMKISSTLYVALD